MDDEILVFVEEKKEISVEVETKPEINVQVENDGSPVEFDYTLDETVPNLESIYKLSKL
ncbi:hypothetical protein NMW79_04985 [Pasteurella multocida]|uniref:hypothetical protein n=1 Tax=Pasteurella canis TaxID=753 RepID=UPI001CC0B6AE|nr:hypothetical protein [Pasteurella canis]MDY0685631.1 hypothetical protein [Pasteurella multocida]UAX42498.1 hypothetical protein K7G89_000316 [Pasteurella canis]HDR0955226.1 hypothetical protein [Pasteurella multocida]HDX1106381.1 hypothetical protein [Pasteurella multocida]